ncbi:MAG: DUF1194 domain-containing protein [Pseudomonadota bacterium]
MIRAPALCLAASLSLASGAAQACEVALVLAVDVSGSVNAQEYQTQMRGLAEALVDPAVEEALVRGKSAVLVMQWTGASRQQISVPWTRMESYSDTKALAQKVAETPRAWRNFSTAIGEALNLSLQTFQEVPDCQRHVIDVSGDGFSNEGIRPQDMRPALAAAGITVNGLAIETDQTLLLEYFERDLIVGPGAFAVRAETYEVYPKRIRQKLLRELTKQFAELCPEDSKC